MAVARIATVVAGRFIEMIASVERFGWIDRVDHSIRAHIEYLR